ncbi:MAG: AMP-binding protein [Gammaproteobacteria bacterium]|nr:AMP-binding protein [Gammaproteobacteria bacterium]
MPILNEGDREMTELTGWFQEFRSLIDYYTYFSTHFYDKEAYVQFQSTLSYGETWENAQKFAGFLQQKNIRKNDRVALVLPNCMPYPVCIMGVHLAGAVVVNLNPEYTTSELEARIKDAAPSAVVILDCFASKLDAVLKAVKVDTVVVVSIGDLLPRWKGWALQLALHCSGRIPAFKLRDAIRFRKALLVGENFPRTGIDLEKSDLAFLQYTGGTTGTLKAAMLSHGNLLANLEQVRLLFGDKFHEGKEINVFALPMYHIFSLTINFLLASGLGVKNILIVDPRELTTVIKQLRRFPISILIGVNTLFDKMMLHPQFSTLNLSKLKLVVAGGMAVHKTVAEKWQKMTGIPILEGYGLTETSPVVCMNTLTNFEHDGSVGLPLACTEIQFLNEQQQVVPEGELGEVAVYGPQVMSGYWHQPAETAQVFTSEGYFLTGDIGLRNPQGLVFLKERKKDMIDISGLKVYPSEVEAVLLEQPHVREAAVIGENTPSGGERVVAYVVSDNPSLLENELIHACRKKLTSYKLPRQIYFCDSLPKNNVGKILKRELRSGLWKIKKEG